MLVLKGEVEKILGENDSEKEIRKIERLKSRTGLFQNNTGLFRVTAIFAVVGCFLLFLKKIFEYFKAKNEKKSNI